MDLPARLYILIVFAGIWAQPTFSQDTSRTISGVVYDAATDQPLPSASIALFKVPDSTLVTGALSQDNGTFVIHRVPYGQYYLRVSYVGYEAEVVSDVSLTASHSVVETGGVFLTTDRKELDEVEVSAERSFMEVGIDRTVYNTANQPITAGGSGRDVLETLPSVEVDIDGNISLRGSQGVIVYLNGKPAPMTGEALTSFLEGLSADNIERIEVIPNPSARYEPDGMSGILNIVLAKNVDIAWGGSASGNFNTRGHFGGSLSTHYGKEAFRVHGNYSLRYSDWDQDGWRYRENRFLDPLTILEQDFKGNRGGLSNNVNVSLDYNFYDRNTLSVSTIVSHRSRISDRLNFYDERNSGLTLIERYSRSTDGDETDFNLDYRMSYQWVITPREHELTIEARYEDEYEDELERYVERSFSLLEIDDPGVVSDRQDVEEDGREREATVEIDYERPLGEKGKLELGYQGEQEWVDEAFYSESINQEGVFLPDENLNNTFTFSSQQHSAYGIIGVQLGKLGTQIGVRLEQALTTFDLTTTGETFENDYFSVFPSVHLAYKVNKKNTFKASYSKRVRRPREWQLNPFGDYDDPTSRREGNPYLKPEYTHSTEVSYSLLEDDYTITISPYYRFTTDEISWRERITEEGVTILTFENFDTDESFGAEFISSFTVKEWLKANMSVNGYKRVTEAGSVASELSNNAIGFRSRLSFTAKLRGDLRLQVSQSYRSPMDIPGGRIAAEYQTDMAIEQRIFSGRGTLNIRARDLFGASSELIERDLERYFQEYFQERNSRSIQLSFRYAFGKGGKDRGDRSENRRRGRR